MAITPLTTRDLTPPAPLPGACATRGMHTARSALCLAHVPRVACTPHAPSPARCMCHAWQAPPPARRMCHTWHAHRTLRPLPGARATCGMHSARAAPLPGACATPDMPRPLPGACATRGTHTARSALCPAHVPHVACTPHAPPPCPVHVPRLASHRTRRPPAWPLCHTWPHAAPPHSRPPPPVPTNRGAAPKT
eukprot:scaffold9302_cov56-Phaeocystis_antarctica.AAC.4